MQSEFVQIFKRRFLLFCKIFFEKKYIWMNEAEKKILSEKINGYVAKILFLNKFIPVCDGVKFIGCLILMVEIMLEISLEITERDKKLLSEVNSLDWLEYN